MGISSPHWRPPLMSSHLYPLTAGKAASLFCPGEEREYNWNRTAELRLWRLKWISKKHTTGREKNWLLSWQSRISLNITYLCLKSVNSLNAFELGRSTDGGRRTWTGRCLLERSTTASGLLATTLRHSASMLQKTRSCRRICFVSYLHYDSCSAKNFWKLTKKKYHDDALRVVNLQNYAR